MPLLDSTPDLVQQLRALQSLEIERIIFMGGGAKGVVYPGSYDAFMQTGIMSGVKQIAGTSIGAITASLVATGVSVEHLRAIFLSTNFKALLGRYSGNWVKKNVSGVCFFTKNGLPILTFLREQLFIIVKTYIDKLENLEALKGQHEEFAKFLMALNEPNFILTFGDLRLLNTLFPKAFKRLTISALAVPNDRTQTQLQIFNAELTPAVEVALACRASVGLPLILEPVPIEVNGITHRYVDPAIFDNLLTDYFDLDSNGHFLENQLKAQTLIWSLSGSQESSEIFQALHGACWDEVISVATLQEILDLTLKEYTEKSQSVASGSEKLRLYREELKNILTKKVENKSISPEESNAIMTASVQSITDIGLLEKKEELAQIRLEKVRAKLAPVLYRPDKFDWLMDKGVVDWLGDLNLGFFPSQQYEKSSQKIKKEYPLRTVELSIGNLTPLDFENASKNVRLFYSMGYLDAMNYIINHELIVKDPSHSNCFEVIMDYFECIYEAIMLGSEMMVEKNTLWQDIQSLKQRASVVLFQNLYQLIKKDVLDDVEGIAAFALIHAVEFYKDYLTPEALFAAIEARVKTEAGFFQFTYFSKSNPPQPKLDLKKFYSEKNYFKLETPRDKVFLILTKMEKFTRFCVSIIPPIEVFPIGEDHIKLA